MNLEEAKSLTGNLSLLQKSLIDVEGAAQVELDQVRKRRDEKLAKIEKQAEGTKEGLAEFVKERFLSRYSQNTFILRGLFRIVDVISVKESSDPGFYRIEATMLQTYGIVPGHQFFCERSDPSEVTKAFKVTLEGVIDSLDGGDHDNKVEIIDDPDGVTFYTSIHPPSELNRNKPKRESRDQLKARIEKFSPQVEEEKNPAFKNRMKAVLQSMKDELKKANDAGDEGNIIFYYE